MDDLIGQSIGRYHIIEQLGQGGMAVVYKAFDTRLEREVAIKLIRRGQFGGDFQEQMLKRFEREAKSLARLDHPNIIPIHDSGEFEGSPYLVMKYINGGTLKLWTGKPMAYRQAASLLVPVARALEYAHSLNVIHRDVKPANILITAGGQPMLSDFGVAKILEGEEGNTLTGSGVGVGTPEYMAPEQWENRVSAQTDIYALGVVFYELVTGRKPFSADTPAAVLRMQLLDPLPRPRLIIPDLPEEVEAALFKALAKQPENRYASMGEFAAVLKRLADVDETRIAPAIIRTVEQANQTVTAPGKLADTTQDAMSFSDTIEKQAGIQAGQAQAKAGQPKWMVIVAAVTIPVICLLAAGGWILLGTFGSSGLGMALSQKQSTSTPFVSSTTTLAATRTKIPVIVAAPPLKTVTALAKKSPDMTTSIPTTITVYSLGSQKTSAVDGMVQLYVPEGKFLMGMSDDLYNQLMKWDADHGIKPVYKDEYEENRPMHTVYLDAFWIDQTVVTNAMFAKCIKSGECQPLNHANVDYEDPKNLNYPVVYLDWNGADTYCKWVGRRLPTEAEWEKAARGTDGRTYPWGEGIDCTKANYIFGGYKECVGHVTKVGSYPDGVSPYGALDMVGNVEQWTADYFNVDYYKSQTTWNNPKGPDPVSGDYMVVRGSSYQRWPNESNVTIRWVGRKVDWGSIGFRCAQ